MNDKEWLSWLNDEIWEKHIDNTSRMVWAREKRKLTKAEFDRLQIIAQSHEFVIEPHNGNMGFGFALTFYEQPAYPGMPIKPIFTINSTHLPQYAGGPSFELGWEILSPFSHNPKNKSLVLLHGLPNLLEKNCYDY